MIYLKRQEASVGDSPIVDESDNNYLQVENFQMCWGTAYSNSSGGRRWMTYPANFDGTNQGLGAISHTDSRYYQGPYTYYGGTFLYNGFYGQSRPYGHEPFTDVRSSSPGLYLVVGEKEQI